MCGDIIILILNIEGAVGVIPYGFVRAIINMIIENIVGNFEMDLENNF